MSSLFSEFSFVLICFCRKTRFLKPDQDQINLLVALLMNIVSALEGTFFKRGFTLILLNVKDASVGDSAESRLRDIISSSITSSCLSHHASELRAHFESRFSWFSSSEVALELKVSQFVCRFGSSPAVFLLGASSLG